MALFRTQGAIDNPSNKIKHEKISYALCTSVCLPYQYTSLNSERDIQWDRALFVSMSLMMAIIVELLVQRVWMQSMCAKNDIIALPTKWICWQDSLRSIL